MSKRPSIISGAFRQPFREQVAFFRNKMGNLVPTARWDDLRRGEHDVGFMVAGAAKADLLADLAAGVERSLSEGKSLQAYRKDFRAAVERRGWHGWTGEGTEKGEAWRTRVIYQTNMATAYAAGRKAQLLEGGFDLWVYKHGGSREPRPQHLAWNGLTLPPDHPFWRTHYAPNDFGCSCYVVGARSEKGAHRLGGDPNKPLPEDWSRINPKTGAPVGIGKNWDYSPGDRVVDVVRQMAGKLEKYPRTIAVDLLNDMTASEAFSHWFNQPTAKSVWPIGIISSAHAQRIGAQTTVVNLSADTVKKQVKEHPEILSDEYRHIQSTLQQGWIVQDGANTMIYVLEAEGYVSVVKSTKTGKGIFVTSFRRLSNQQAKRDEELKRLQRKENKGQAGNER